jgi:hypothetical protein
MEELALQNRSLEEEKDRFARENVTMKEDRTRLGSAIKEKAQEV